MKKFILLFGGLLAIIGHIKANPTPEDSEIGKLVDNLTRQEMSNSDCYRGIVYVVETKTGRLIAHTSIEGADDNIVPFIDTFYKEDDYIQGAVTYLALLSSGTVTPDTEIDTENGIYIKPNGEEVRDHNWRRGGYGLMRFESVLTHRSVVGYTMAIDSVYGNNMVDYFLKRRDYTAGIPETLMGRQRLLRVPWTGRSNQSILKEINPEYSLEGLMLKLKLQYFGHLM